MSNASSALLDPARLQDLRRLRVMDSEPDVLIDEMTRLAARICDAPIALVTLLDENRQWFKSSFGIHRNETSIEQALCVHALHSTELLVIEDATQDPRSSAHPWVLGGPLLRSYAGAPLVTKNGNILGTLCVLDQRARNFTEPEKLLLSTLARQVSERFEAAHSLQDYQSKLVESHRLARLGEMGAKISHEMNTPLSIIVIRVSQIRRKLEQMLGKSPEYKDLSEDLNKIDAVITRVSKIVRGFNLFGRTNVQDPTEETDLVSLIEETLAFCRTRVWNQNVDLRVSPAEGTIFSDCRAVQVSQIILNLIINSLDAVQSIENKWIEIDVQQVGTQIEIRVTNSGPSIPPEIEARLFEPFFTTKPLGVGTGLGLCISRDLARNHPGELSYEPKNGHTSFVLRIPAQQSGTTT